MITLIRLLLAFLLTCLATLTVTAQERKSQKDNQETAITADASQRNTSEKNTLGQDKVVIPVPPKTRPRVLVNPNTLGKIRKRFESRSMKSVKAKILEQAKAVDSGTPPEGKKVSKEIYRAIESNAVLYLLKNNKKAGEKAVRMIQEAMPALNPQNEKMVDDRLNHRVIYTAAMVYDWCYDLMTDEEREFLYDQTIRLLEKSEYGWPLAEGRITYLVNHFGEEKVPSALAFGMAAYEQYPSVYNEAARHLYEGLVPSRNGFYPAHRHHQGSAYGPGRYEWEVLSTFLITQMGAERPYIDEQGKVLYHNMYNRRPDDVIFAQGDDFNPSFIYRAEGSGYFGLHGAMVAANEYQDPYLQDEVQRHLDFKEKFDHLDDGVLLLLYQDEILKPESVENLPLTKFFNEPIASMTARTAWDMKKGMGSNAVIATMEMSNYYFGNHDHLDAGHFNLYYKGPLAIDSGAYAESEKGKGKHGGDSGHWNNYFRRSVAHNTILVQDYDEPYRPMSIWDAQNEGGQVINAGGPIEQYNGGAPLSFQEMVEEGGEQVKLLGRGFGPDSIAPDYSYLKGDMANAYAYSYLKMEPKVEEAKRSFVFLNLKNKQVPGALIVFDKVTARKPDFKKRWLMHFVEKPEVEGAVTTLVKKPGRLDYSGKLVNETILPRKENLNIEVIGGKGKRFWTESADTNWALAKEEDVTRFEAGEWRIEVSPKKESATDHFFNVMQVMDKGTEALSTKTVETEQHIGVQIYDRMVLFAKDGNRLTESFDLKVETSEKELKVLITDIKAGKWKITGDAISEAYTVSEEAGVLYAVLPVGSYRVVRE
ncbi:heparinase II/III family protein [Maribacter sp. 2210JD10-5]|uniref:heparinase II/III domain-containing protein n=1 Tax=Maribacter sp. 2210JD10-5 TaxID=3386272 RepID=UPI0039BCCE98